MVKSLIIDESTSSTLTKILAEFTQAAANNPLSIDSSKTGLILGSVRKLSLFKNNFDSDKNLSTYL